MKNLLSTLRFKGQIQCVKTLAEAVSFLNSVENIQGQKKPADLIFASYDSKKQGNVVDVIEKLTRQGVNENKNEEQEPRIQIPQKVIICSIFDLQSFITFVKQKGAKGFLHMPIDEEQFKQTCLSNGLILN